MQDRIWRTCTAVVYWRLQILYMVNTRLWQRVHNATFHVQPSHKMAHVKGLKMFPVPANQPKCRTPIDCFSSLEIAERNRKRPRTLSIRFCETKCSSLCVAQDIGVLGFWKEIFCNKLTFSINFINYLFRTETIIGTERTRIISSDPMWCL